MVTQQADVAIVGAGILGLAHALEAAKRGHKVVLFERSPRANGASIRNFGMIFPVGTAPGVVRERALRSRAVWLAVAPKAGFWHNPVGSLIVAYHEDEMAVLTEFCRDAPPLGYACQLLDAAETLERSPGLNPTGLLGALWSPTEIVVDPREAISKLPHFLTKTYGVIQRFSTAVTAIELPYVRAGGETWKVERAVVCSGVDFETLYPETFKQSGLTRCKLQMLRTAPQPDAWHMGPMLATGLSLRHYPAFGICPSLPELRERVVRDYPALERWGIHLLVSQNGLGEVTLGDSHEYGLDPEPFDRLEIDDLILDYLQKFLRLPALTINQRWHGIYAKHFERDAIVETPAPNVRVVNGVGSTGMTTSFGLAQEVFEGWG